VAVAVDVAAAGVAVVAAAGGVEMRAQSTSTGHAMENTMRSQRNQSPLIRGWAWVSALLSALALAAGAHAAAPAQKTFASPEDAAAALVQAVKAHDRAAFLAVLGNASEWVSSGDKAADRAAGDSFVAAYEAKHTITRDGDTARMTIGNDDFPFAFPLVKTGDRWRFDTAAGKDEMLARRIGENELDAIKVLQAIVDAQRDYASEDRNGDGVVAYAQRFVSSTGKRDGLYWPTKTGEAPSPLGPLVVRASGEGYKREAKGPTPYHGYYYRLLKGQGANAEGGALDYVVRGRAIGGFAAVAWPAKYGNSGIMTFMVNQDGRIYQSDLGPGSADKAAKIQRFDPGPGWTAVVPK
jgi:hypothetical protein